MNKRAIISEILLKIFQMSIPYLQGVGTDISINYDFLDAKWNNGRKTIHYEAYAYFNEQRQTVFLYELTKERSAGLSFGNKSESYTQRSTTLYRKVKGMKYGPDGTAYEYEMNLENIIKTFKNCAKDHNWKVKTVFHKEDAMYPAGYAVPYAASNIPSYTASYNPPYAAPNTSPDSI